MNQLTVVEDLARDRRIHSIIAFNGRIMKPSMRENFLIENYVKTLSMRETCEAYKGRYGKEMSITNLSEWLKKPYIRDYVNERLKIKAIANGLDEDRWRACGLMMLAEDCSCLELIRKIFDKSIFFSEEKPFRVTRAMTFMWERIGEANGWLSRGASLVNYNNTEIRVLQANGKE